MPLQVSKSQHIAHCRVEKGFLFHSISSFSFVLKQKKRSKRKIQGCDKKAKKQLHSAKVVKLALYS